MPSRLPDPRSLLVPASLLLWGTCVVGAVVVGASAFLVYTGGAWLAVALLLGLAVAAELLRVRIHDFDGQQLSFSFAAPLTLASVSLIPAAAPLVALTAALAHAVTSRQRHPSKVGFNVANTSVAAGAACLVSQATSPLAPYLGEWQVVLVGVAAAAYYVVNEGVLALMVSLHSKQPLAKLLGEQGWSLPTKALFGLTGAFLGAAYPALGVVGIVLFAAPLLTLRWTLAFNASRSRRAIEQLRALNSRLADESERRRHQALHDALTGLPNRLLLREQLEQTLVTSRSCVDSSLALLLLDLDRFKEVNDTFGHQRGDLLLLEVAARLRSWAADGVLVARLGGDEFAILLPEADRRAATSAAREILAAVSQPQEAAGYALDVGASLGIALGPEHGPDAETLLQRADVAMYAAKSARSGFAVYDPEQDKFSPERLALVAELRQAISADELMLYYQPKADPRSSRVVGVEALVRWKHARRGFIPPDQIVALAEHTGLIRPLSRWVLETAIKQARRWLLEGLDLPVAVNLSAHDLDDVDLPTTIGQLLESYSVPAGLLRLEMTEGAMLIDPARSLEVLAQLQALGIGISIDDFGTGYSSLTYLKRLPVDELKIDRAFIAGLVRDERDAVIVRSTIALAHDLGLSVVAEGVEDLATWERLRRYGCDQVQGYLMSPPIPAPALTTWVASGWAPPARELDAAA